MAAKEDDFLESKVIKTQTGQSFQTLSLPTIALGGRGIRYVIVSRSKSRSDKWAFFPKDKTTCSMNTEETLRFITKQNVGIPLFMASDVLSGMGQLPKNNCRIHSRYGRDGLATKLSFADFRLNGVANCNSVWFYSIQGSFKAVFEYQDIEVQKDFLLNLRELWLNCYARAPLPESISLALDDAVCTLFDSLKTRILDTSDEMHHFVPHEELVPSNVNPSSSSSSSTVSSVALNDYLKHIMVERTNHPTEKDLTVISDVLEFLRAELEYYRESQGNCFPFEIFKCYQDAICDHSLRMELRKSGFEVPTRRTFALCAIADWLGREFHSFEQSISKRVENFKKDHLHCLDNLPSAEKLVNSLFPCAMKRLLSSWIGLNVMQSTDAVVQDHNYSPPEKHSRKDHQQTRNLFPLIQIILEFANNALVSGTAHVVFSRLRYAT